MDIPYRQLNPSEALRVYGDWLMESKSPFFKGNGDIDQNYEWYTIFYPLRTLIMCGKIFNEKRYFDAAFPHMDTYVSEQLPNGAFIPSYKRRATGKLSKKEFQAILREGSANIADAGSNLLGIMQALSFVDAGRKKRYIAAVRKWFDEWAVIWQLKDGCGNGIWEGKKINSPYTMAMSNLAAAYSAFGVATGEYEYIENAERLISAQLPQWLPDGRPLNMSCYPLPRKDIIDDYARIFYLLEGMCWTHYASKNKELKNAIATRLKEWIFGKKGILTQWDCSWFNFNSGSNPPDRTYDLGNDLVIPGFNFNTASPSDPGYPADRIDELMPTSRVSGVRPGWELAKSNGIIHLFLYYLEHIEENPVLREKTELGIKFLSNPLKSRMSYVATELDESYGKFTIQATGFAGISLAQAIKRNIVFEL